MATTVRVYRHSPTVVADPTGTLVDTEVDADDLPGTVSVDTTGWTAGSYEVTVTAQADGDTESLRSNARALTVNAPSVTLDVVSVSAWARKAWDTTRVLTLPTLTLAAGQRAALMVAIEDGGSGYTGTNWTFAGLGFTPATSFTQGAGAGGAKTAIFWADPGAGTYNGTITMGGTGTCTFACAWVILQGASATPTNKTSVNYIGAASAPSSGFATTGTGKLLIGIAANVDSGAAGTAASGAAIPTGGQEGSNTPGAYIIRRTGLVAAGTHTIGLTAPTSADWSVCAIEINPA